MIGQHVRRTRCHLPHRSRHPVLHRDRRHENVALHVER